MKLRSILLLLSLAANGILVLVVAHGNTLKSKDIAPAASPYPLLSKRLFANEVNDVLINFTDLRKQIKEYIAKNNLSESLGLYFEYLPSGVSAGINEDQPFIEASLIKLPAVMALYKQIGADKRRFDDVLTIQPDDVDRGYGDLWKKGAGAQITVREAVRLILTESDNTAYRALLRYSNDSIRKTAFAYLDIPEMRSSVFPIVSPKNYSSILRSLYLSSYLQKEDSNEILDILTKNIDMKGIAAGVPADVVIAHKTSFFIFENQEVHDDCGVIFLPARPYMLCIMIKDLPETEDHLHMNNLSAIIYRYVTNAHTDTQ